MWNVVYGGSVDFWLTWGANGHNRAMEGSGLGLLFLKLIENLMNFNHGTDSANVVINLFKFKIVRKCGVVFMKS